MFSEKTWGIAIALALLLSSSLSVCKNFWHFVISLLLLKIFTRSFVYVFTIKRAILTIKWQFKLHFFFQNDAPFSTWDFLSSIKHPTAKLWHPHAVLLLHVCSTSLLKTLCEKKKLLVLSNFSFPDCFLPIWKIFCFFCKIDNCHLQILSVEKSLKFVVLERGNSSPNNFFTHLLLKWEPWHSGY